MSDKISALTATGLASGDYTVIARSGNNYKVDLFSRSLPSFSASDYGAVGDGVTDDRAAIQNACNVAYSAGGGVVKLQAKTYAIQVVYDSTTSFNNSLTFTVDAGTDVITTSAPHNFAVGTIIRVSSTVSLPGNLLANTNYYVISVPSSTTITVSSTAGGSIFDISSAGTGTHSISHTKANGHYGLEIPSNVILEGAGSESTILLAVTGTANADTGALIAPLGWRSAVSAFSASNNFTLRDLQLKAQSSTDEETGILLSAVHTSGMLCERVKFNTCYYHQLEIDYSKNVKFRDCVFTGAVSYSGSGSRIQIGAGDAGAQSNAVAAYAAPLSGGEFSNCLFEARPFTDLGPRDIDLTHDADLFITGLKFINCEFNSRNATPLAVTADNTTDTFTTATAHGLSAGDIVEIEGATIPTNTSKTTNYYIINPTATTFQISTSLGGGAVDFSSNGTSVYFIRTTQDHIIIGTDSSNTVATCDNIQILNCIFNVNDQRYGYAISAAHASYSSTTGHANNWVIDGCKFYGTAKFFILVGNGSGSSISLIDRHSDWKITNNYFEYTLGSVFANLNCGFINAFACKDGLISGNVCVYTGTSLVAANSFFSFYINNFSGIVENNFIRNEGTFAGGTTSYMIYNDASAAETATNAATLSHYRFVLKGNRTKMNATAHYWVTGAAALDGGANFQVLLSGNQTEGTGTQYYVLNLYRANAYEGVILTGTGSLDFNLGALAEESLSVTVEGARSANNPSVALGWSSGLPSGLVVKQARVTGDNGVSVTLANYTSGAINPTALTCRATVIQF